LYDVAPVTQESGTGARQLSVDALYQDDANVAKDLADFIRHEYEVLNKQVEEVMPDPHKSAALLRHVLDREPGDLTLLTESVVGFTGVPAIIHHVGLRVVTPELLECTWGLAPSVAGQQWILGEVGRSEVGDTTVWGYA
jgi:hypothetical protein